jgi:5,10-methenyltetrahydromethanopterin hydrogenase
MLKGRGACKAGTARGITAFKLSCLVAPEFSLSIEAYVLPRLSAHIPLANLIQIPLVFVILPIMADPHFNSPGSFDIILGADINRLLMRQGIQRVLGTQLVAQNTVLG